MYAELAIYQAPVRRTFHYLIPQGMSLAVGQLVDVSFRTARSQGIVVALTDESPVPHPKPILEELTAEPVVTPTQIALAQWMAEQTMSPLGACLWLMLPPGVTRRGDMLYTLVDPQFDPDAPGNESLGDKHRAGLRGVIGLLRERGTLRGAQIDRALPKTHWREALPPLIAAGIVSRESFLAAPGGKAHTVKTVRLAIPAEQVPEAIKGLTRSQKQIDVLAYLATQTEPVALSEIAEHTGADAALVRRLAEKQLVILEDAEQWRDPLANRDFEPSSSPTLTSAQAEAWETIQAHMQALRHPDEPSQTYLLHGVTGSGKTEIYLRSIEYVLAQGRQAIALVPEIALVPQTVQRFASRFPGRVAVLHSRLTPGEQYDTWRRVWAGQVDVVVGPRSALFLPLRDVGVVVLDEEHDDSYKQGPPIPPPYYHARETAIAMMQITRGTVILGSATPDINTSFRAHRGEIERIRLPDRVMVQRPDAPPGADPMVAALPPVQVIDMRQELRTGNRSMFSHALRTALNETLERGEQAMLYLNRRGTASFVLCRDCGYVAKCPRCEMPLTYHQSDAKLSCHYCGYRGPQPEKCPQCGGSRIRYFGAGTASLEEAVAKEFPAARSVRWDRDTTQERDSHDAILQKFIKGEANVLIGTQMIAKGLDIPRVTLVGVVLADTALGLPDYRAGERTFQLLTQVAGRAGRGWLGGRVIFQTYQPDHYAIRAASKHDYEAFYAKEIEYRRMLRYPPYKRLVRFQFSYSTEAQARREAEHAAELLRQRIAERNMSATELVGPAPAFFSRIDELYQWHILAKTTDAKMLLDELTIRPGWHVDIDPVDIL